MRNRAKYLKYRIILHILRIIHRLNLLNVFVFPFPFFFPLQRCFTNKWKNAIGLTVYYIHLIYFMQYYIYIYIHVTWPAQDRCAKSKWQVHDSYSPNTITRVILTVLTLALGISPRDDTLLVSLVGPWRNAPPCDHIVATITA